MNQEEIPDFSGVQVVNTEPEAEPLKMVGFWFEKGVDPGPDPDPWLSWPVAKEDGFEDQERFVTKLQFIQDYMDAENFRLNHRYPAVQEMRGFSPCRCCDNITNGSRQYNLMNFCWPEGYIHYIRDHNIEPDPEFKEMVMAFVVPPHLPLRQRLKLKPISVSFQAWINWNKEQAKVTLYHFDWTSTDPRVTPGDFVDLQRMLWFELQNRQASADLRVEFTGVMTYIGNSVTDTVAFEWRSRMFDPIDEELLKMFKDTSEPHHRFPSPTCVRLAYRNADKAMENTVAHMNFLKKP